MQLQPHFFREFLLKIFLGIFFMIFLSTAQANIFYKLYRFPEDGITPFYQPITQAKKNIILITYILTFIKIENALVNAKKRGVRVHVMLEPSPYLSQHANDEAKKLLQRAGISIELPNPQFAFTHQKALVIDDIDSFIMTFNFTFTSFKHERNFAIATNDPAIAREISDFYQADLNRQSPFSTQTTLAWSPLNSYAQFKRFFKGTKNSLDLYVTELKSWSVIHRLVYLARHGVKVRILTNQNTPQSQFYPSCGLVGLINAGVSLHYLPQYLIHAKAGVRDPGKNTAKAYVGSVNFTDTSFNKNRELSIFLSEPLVVTELHDDFASDWNTSKPLLISKQQIRECRKGSSNKMLD
ncbi:MAG: hypothetical protein KIT27_10130 [Legionellales bacterium]|nr:hypothetical protein [Legionellales bacterium]